MKRLKVVSSLLMMVLSPIVLGGCTVPYINEACFKELLNIETDDPCVAEWEFRF